MTLSPATKRRVPLHKKLAGLALGTVLSLLCLEVTLWALHARYAPESRVLAELAPRPGERRILCMGDSNTYGMYLDAANSYPGRLQSYLDAAPGNPWRVFNLGYPGQNTAQMRARLARNLDAYQPEILVLWGGANNSWSPAMSHLWDHPDSEPSGVTESWLDRSRALKALGMMFLEGRRVTFEGGERRYAKRMTREGDFAVPGLAGAERGEGLGDVESVSSKEDKVAYTPGDLRRGIGIDLRRVHAICEERGVALLLGQYWVDQEWVDTRINAAIAEVAGELGIPVVPLRDRLRALVDTYGFDRILFHDYHAKDTGNREVARQVLHTLIGEGLLERVPEWMAVPPLEDVLGPPDTDRAPLAIEVTTRVGDVLEVRLSGPLRSRYVVEVQELVRSGTEGEVVTRTLAAPGEDCTGRLDRHGSAYRRIHLPQDHDASVVGWRLSARFAEGVHANELSSFVDVSLEPGR